MGQNLQQKRKQFFPINNSFRDYLQAHGRFYKLPLVYEDLLQYEDSFPLINEFGEDTLWQTLLFERHRGQELYEALKRIYVQLRSEGQESVLKNLYIDRVDLCTFGNTKPMRVRVVNQFNDNHDYFYIKKADASRVYGLELEELLSPNAINFLIWQDTLIEEHIIGVPGDQFIKEYLPRSDIHEVRLAKEFIKFNERSFVRLLGDMRAYNYVVEVTPDFEENQYRVRAIDFDQQCYEGKRTMYLPQFFKNNLPVVQLCTRLINKDTALQYQQEERALIKRRINFSKNRIAHLKDCMCADQISSLEKTEQLKKELSEMHQDARFLKCKNMGEITFLNLSITLNLAKGQDISTFII
ncbi:MAG: hypothetical protein DBX03_03225 [Puniceicoccaceae bacterium]|nr:MAG: hypothetical protein DBX03_03225 [Puniceicoccaceae bacterium]